MSHIKTLEELRECPAGMTTKQWHEAVKEARNAHFDAAEKIRKAADIRRVDVSADDRRAIAAHLDHVEQLGKFMEDAPEFNAVDFSQVIQERSGNRVDGGSQAEYRDGLPLTREQSFAGFARSKGLVTRGEDELDLGRYLEVVCANRRGSEYEAERRAMSEGTNTAGGYLVPTLLSSTMIDLARNAARVGQAGASYVPMANQKVDVPKWTGDPVAAWRAEAATISTSDATIGKISLVAKSLAGITVVSRELLEDAPEVGNELKTAFTQSIGLEIDAKALYGTGASNTPTGIKSAAGITTLTNGTNGAALTNWDPLVNGVYSLKALNETPNGVIYAPRTGKNLALLKDTTNQSLLPPSYLDGIPRYETNQVPINLTVGTSNDCTDIFTADWRQLIIGMRTELIITPLLERYADTGQVGFVAWLRADIAVARPAAFAVQTGIR